MDNAGTFSYRDANAINLQNYTVSPTIAAQISLFGLPANYTNNLGLGNITLTAGGNITQAAGANLTGVQALNATTTGAGNITLNEATNNTNTLRLRTDGGSATYRDTNGFAINGIQLDDGAGANGNLTLSAGGAGNITQTADITQINNFNLATGTGSATLTRAGNNVASFNVNTAAGNASTIAFTDVNGFTLGNSNVGNGNLALRSAGGGAGAGNITQIAGTSVRGNNLSLQTGSGTANVGQALNNFNNLTSNSTSGNITYQDANTINLRASNVGTGTLNVSTVLGDINQSGLLVGGNLLVNANQGNINLFVVGLANDFNNLGLSASNNASYLDADGININSASGAGNTLSITAGNAPNPNGQDTATGITINSNITAQNINLNAEAGNITQVSGNFTGGNLNLATDGGNATVNNADFTNLTVNTNNGNTTYSDTDGINIGDSNVGTGDLTVNSSIIGLLSNNNNAETDLILSGNITGQTINLSASGADNINQTAGTVQGTNLNLATTGNSIDIIDADSYQVSFNAANANTINYTESDGYTITGPSNLGASTATFGINSALLSNNNDPLAPETAIIASNLSGGNLILNGNANFTNVDFATVAANGTDINVSISDTDGLQVLDSDLGNAGSLNVITQTTGANTNGNPLGAEDNLALNGNINGQTVSLEALANNIDQISGIATGQDLIVKSNVGDITLLGAPFNNNFNDFVNLQATSNSGTVAYVDDNDINLLASNVGTGNLYIRSELGNINQSGAISGNNLVTQTAFNGDINLTNTNNLFNDFTGLSSDLLGNGGNINYTNNGNINLSTATSPIFGGTLPFDSGTGTINIITTAGSNGNINILSDIDGQTINLDADGIGIIQQTLGTSITGNTLTTTTDAGDVLLGIPTNDVNDFQATSTSGSVGYADANNINLLASNVGTGNLIIGSFGAGNITQSGSLTGNNLVLGATQGSIILNTALNDFNVLNMQAAEDAFYADADGIALVGNNFAGDGSTITNIFSVTAGNSPNPNGQDGIIGININSPSANDISFGGLDINGGMKVFIGPAPVIVTAGTVNLTAQAGNITQSGGTVQGANLNLITQGRNATINDADFTNLTANTNNGNADYSDKDGINVNDSNVGTGTLTVNSSVPGLVADNNNAETNITLSGDITGQTVNLNANGADSITQVSGDFTGGNLNLNTQGGTVNLGINGNTDFAIVGGSTNNGTANYIDTDGLTVSDFNVGNGKLNIISSKGNNSVNLNGDPFGPENDIVLNGMLNGANVNLTAQTNNAIVQTGGEVNANNLLLQTNTGNASLLSLNNNIGNLRATSNSGIFTINELNGLNILPSNLGTGSLTVNSGGTINVVGSLSAASGIALTADNSGNINLGNNILSALNGSIQLRANTGSINGLDRNNYPRLIAPDIILIGNKVGDINAPIGLWQGMQSGYIIDRANQTGFSPRPNYLFEYNFIKNLLLSENGFSLYPVLIPPLSNGFLFTIKTNTKTPVIANVLAGQAKQGPAGNFYTTTSGSYILYNNESNNNQPKISTDNMISGLENYIKASGKVVLDNSRIKGDKFIKTAGQFVSPVNSDNVEYTVSAGAFLPVDHSDIAFPSDKNREVKNIDQ